MKNSSRKRTTCLSLCILLALVLLFGFFSLLGLTDNQAFANVNDSKIYCKATLEDSFADNRIIVVVKSDGSDKNYSVKDFINIPLKSVEDLSFSINNSLNNNDTYSDFYIKTLCLELKEKNKQKVLDYIKVLENMDDVLCAEPDYLLESAFEPNDPYYTNGDLWGLNGENGIDCSDAWTVTQGSSSVKVGVIDSGIYANHVDLRNNVDRELSYDFSNDSTSSGALNDTHGHGTHVAGTIGAQGNNSIGVTGVNLDVDLVSLKINESGSTSSFASKLISAVNYAQANDIKVLNDSNNYSSVSNVSASLDIAIQNYDGLFVNSAGNKGRNLNTYNILPCSASLDNVLVVGAIEDTGARWSSSNYGESKVHIYAPGVDIISTLPLSVDSSGYGSYQGTSMATPHVAGVAALLLSMDPTLTGSELKSIIINSADTIEIDKGTVRKLNAYKAVCSVDLVTDIYNTMAISDTEIRIDGLKNSFQGSLEIPYCIGNKIVTEIGDEAFAGQSGITEVVIPSGVERIGDSAFFNCTGLEKVYFEEYSKLNYIGGYAFQQCIRLKSLQIPEDANISYGIASFSEQLTFYTDAPYKPSSWQTYWNSAEWISIERPVVWGCSLSEDGSYVVSFTKSNSSISKSNAVNGVSEPCREGYTFGGWYNNANFNGTPISSEGIVSAANNVTYYAKWIPNCDIIFDTNGADAYSFCETVEHGSMVDSPNVNYTKDGYVFKYWALSTNLNQEYNWNTAVIDNIKLVAVWQEIGNNNVVTFDTNNGESIVNQVLVADGEKVSAPSQPTRVGYTFSHWALSGESSAYNFNTPVTSDITLVAVWKTAQAYTVTFNVNGGDGNYPAITVNPYNSVSEPEVEPVRTGYYFKYWALSTNLNQEYNWNTSVSQNITLVAVWESFNVTVLFNANGGDYELAYLSLNKGDTVGEFINKLGMSYPTRTGYTFKFWGTSPNASSAYNLNSTVNQSFTLYAVWRVNTYSVSFDLAGGTGSCPMQTIDYGSTATRPSDPTRQDYTFKYWALSGQTTEYDFNTPITSNITLVAVWEENPKCIAAGTLITLADGTQKAVEELTGDEMLLVWNMATGTLDVAPILFIDSDPVAMYSVINLYFSDGTQVKVISEHGFWDYNLNKYVYLDKDAAQYIGHWFNKLSTDENGNSVSEKVQLVNVVIQDEYTTAWSPVTYGHYCYYVNGMLSMPGGIEGMFNIFEVDAETMKYDEAQMQADIAQYGLFTYEEFAELFPISEEVFEAFNGQYLKVAMGKGLIDAEGLQTLIERYAEFLNAIG